VALLISENEAKWIFVLKDLIIAKKNIIPLREMTFPLLSLPQISQKATDET
jgi:hypothetical protein